MSSPSNHKAHSPWMRLRIAAGHCVRGLLILTLLGQGALIGLLHYYRDIPVPDFLLKQLHDQLESEGITFTSQSIKIDSSGELLIKDVKFYHKDFKEPLLTTQLAIAKFSLLQLLVGQWSLDSIRIADASLHCPGLYSPSGIADQALENIFLDIAQDRQGWTIQNVQFQSGSLHTSVHGYLPHPVLRSLLKPDAARKDLDLTAHLHQTLQYLEAVIRQRKRLEHLKQPSVRILLQSDHPTSLQAQIEYRSLGVAHPDGIQTGPISGQFILDFDNHWTLQGKGSYLETDFARWQNQVKTQAVRIQIAAQEVRLNRLTTLHTDLLPHLEIYTHANSIHSLRLDVVTIQLRAYHDTSLHFDAFVNQDHHYIDLQAAINPSNRSGTITLDAYWNPTLLLASDWIPTSPIINRFSIPDTPSLQATLQLGPNFSFAGIDFIADFARIAYRDIDLVHLSARGNYVDHKLNILAADLISQHYAVTGSYWQNMNTLDYRFLLEGTVDPTDLNTVIDEDWWLELWPMFTFHSELPYCNIDLSGRYFGGAQHRRIFAFNRFQDTSFRDTRLRQFTAYLLGLPTSIRLHQLKAEGYRGGNTDLDIQWDYRRGPSSKYMTQFEGTSSLPLDDAARMIGQETVDFAADFALDDLPNIHACGIIFGHNSDREGEEFLHIRGHIDQPVSYSNVHFDFLNFTAFKTAQHLQLWDMKLGLGLGTVTGEIDVTLTDDPPHIRFAAEMKRAQYQKIVAAMPTIFDSSAEETTDEEPQNPTHIDLELRAQGPFAEIWQLSGEGRIQIYDTDFGRIHLMGALSRYIFNVVKINFGSLKFDRAESTFSFQQGIFSFPDVRISGPTARMDASGQLKLPEEELDFEILLSPFGEVETPILSQLLYVFNPLASSLKAELTGTIDEPVYDIDFKPLKAFTGNTLNPPNPPPTNN